MSKSTKMTLPKFTYHPEPLRTESIIVSPERCVCCQEARGYIYAGPVYAVDELKNRICPWCIADGTAHEKFDAEFTDAAGVGGYGEWDEVSNAVCHEIAYRTPGFSGWQQEKWWTHCGDGGEFLGCVGYAEAVALGCQLLDAFDCGFTGDEREAYLKALHRDNGPTGYAFRCRHCGTLGGYSDIH